MGGLRGDRAGGGGGARFLRACPRRPVRWRCPTACSRRSPRWRRPRGCWPCAAPRRSPPPDKLTGSRYLVLDGVQDPGNLGTIWRTADAFGADGLLLVNGCADPWRPKTIRATMGALLPPARLGGGPGDRPGPAGRGGHPPLRHRPPGGYGGRAGRGPEAGPPWSSAAKDRASRTRPCPCAGGPSRSPWREAVASPPERPPWRPGWCCGNSEIAR